MYTYFIDYTSSQIWPYNVTSTNKQDLHNVPARKVNKHTCTNQKLHTNVLFHDADQNTTEVPSTHFNPFNSIRYTCHLPCHMFHVVVHHGRRWRNALYIVLCPLCVQGDGEGRGPLTGQMPNVRARGRTPDARNCMCVSSQQPTPARGVVSRARACVRTIGDE